MPISQQNIYLNHLRIKAASIVNEPKWAYLFNEHLGHSLYLFKLATTEDNKRFYRDSISRANKVFEGVINLLFKKAKEMEPGISNQNTLASKTQELLDNKLISNIFRTKLDSYRQDFRNLETHKIFIELGIHEAESAINDALILFNVGLENYKVLEMGKYTIDNLSHLYLLFSSFIECFTIYSHFFSLYDKRSNGIYSANINELLELIQNYYNNSIFSSELTLSSHESKNRLRPHYKVSLGNSFITFNIIKISDYAMIHSYGSISRLIEKINLYHYTFDNLFFLIWSFTKRKRLWREVLPLFENIPHFHIDGLNKFRNILEYAI